MRVGVIGPMYPDSFADNIVDCLPDVGVEAVALGGVHRKTGQRHADLLLGHLSRQSRPIDIALQRSVVTRALDAECDMVISVNGTLRPEAVKRIRDGGVKVALWFPDAVSSIGHQLMFAAPYHRLYFKDPQLVERLIPAAIPAAYMPEACNPHWHTPNASPGVESHFVVAGNLYPTRARLMRALTADGIPLRVYGAPLPRWLDNTGMPEHSGRSVYRHEKAVTFRRAAGVLNNLHPAEQGVNARMFEAAGSGAAVLCEDRPVLRDLFDVGTEVLTFSTYAELLAGCRALMRDPELTRSIGDAAAARAHRDHTYQIRLRSILEDCA